MEKQTFVYILASKRNGTLYTGVTSNLPKPEGVSKNRHAARSRSIQTDAEVQ